MVPTKSVPCETEYRRSFKKSQFACSAAIYQRNLDFRTEQKRRFVEHNPEPFTWNPDDLESDSELSCSELNKPRPLTRTQYKHEKLNRLYEKRMREEEEEIRELQRRMRREEEEEEMREVRRRMCMEELRGQRSCGTEYSHNQYDVPNENECEDYYSSSDSEASVVHIIEPEPEAEHQRPIRKIYRKRAQTTKVHPERPTSSPFVAYGYEADAMETGKKYTHNVRAAQQVYPSALMAQKMRKSDSHKGHSQFKNNQISGKSAQVPNNIKCKSSEPMRIFIHSEECDSPEWVSEYERNFQQYDAKAYRNRPYDARVHAVDLTPKATNRRNIRTTC